MNKHTAIQSEPAAEPITPGVQRSLGRLDKSIDALGEVVSELTARLTPIRNIAPTMEALETDLEDGKCDVDSSIISADSQVHVLRARIENLISEIAL